MGQLELQMESEYVNYEHANKWSFFSQTTWDCGQLVEAIVAVLHSQIGFVFKSQRWKPSAFWIQGWRVESAIRLQASVAFCFPTPIKIEWVGALRMRLHHELSNFASSGDQAGLPANCPFPYSWPSKQTSSMDLTYSCLVIGKKIGSIVVVVVALVVVVVVGPLYGHRQPSAQACRQTGDHAAVSWR